MKKLIFAFLVIVVSTCSLYSQTRTIKGRVIDDQSLDPLRYVAITIKDTVQVGRTDLSGFFQIEIPVSEKKILFRYVGMEPAAVELFDTCDELEVVMIFRDTYDFMSPKKVDRLRKKKFEKLPDLHKRAFDKGVFKTDKACFKQEFIP